MVRETRPREAARHVLSHAFVVTN